MAWDDNATRVMTERSRENRREVDPRFASLLSDVAAGRKGKEEAWQEWLKIKASDEKGGAT